MSNLKPSAEKPWMKYFPKESQSAEMPYRTIYDSVRKNCMEHPSKKALYYYGTSVTYGDFLKRVDALADAYYGIGVREGDMVSFLMPTTPESIYSLYALSKIGATPNFIDPRMDIGRILDAAEGVHSRLMVSIDVAFPKVEKILPQLSVEKIIIAPANISLMLPVKLAQSLTTKTPKIPYDLHGV